MGCAVEQLWTHLPVHKVRVMLALLQWSFQVLKAATCFSTH